MEQRSWRWTDAHFCSLPSQTNIYGCSKIENRLNNSNKLLVASLVGKIFTVEYQRIFDKLTPSTKEVHFTYIPGEAEIVSVNAANKCCHGNGLTIGITFWKQEENESKQFLHIYYASQSGYEFNLDSVAQGCQSLELSFVPYHLMHTDLVIDNYSETVFLLSGSDNKVHLYREINYLHYFKEHDCEEHFPELTNLPSVVIWLDVMYYNNNTRRITTCGHQDGCLTVCVVNVQNLEVIDKFTVNHDNPVTYVQTFSLHNRAPRPAFLAKEEEPEEDDGSIPEFSILVLSALLPATVYRNVLQCGVGAPVYLPDSNKFDAVLTGCVIDIDFDGENEILIGTYGQEVLAYKLSSHAVRPSEKSSPSTIKSGDMQIMSPTRFRHRSGESDKTSTPKYDFYQSSRRAKSQENLSSSLSSELEFGLRKDVPGLEQDQGLQETFDDSIFSEDECRLLWQRSFAYPVIGINRMDIMGDGMEDLVIVTLKGVHILQPDLNEVASVCLERLKLLAHERGDLAHSVGETDTSETDATADSSSDKNTSESNTSIKIPGDTDGSEKDRSPKPPTDSDSSFLKPSSDSDSMSLKPPSSSDSSFLKPPTDSDSSFLKPSSDSDSISPKPSSSSDSSSVKPPSDSDSTETIKGTENKLLGDSDQALSTSSDEKQSEADDSKVSP